MVEVLQQVIINILHRSYSISYDAAWKIWYKAKIKKDPRVYNIISNLIHDSKEGLPFFVNRPPTIQFGSTLFMRCVGINDNYTMSVPLEVLPLWAGDFDGDTLSILYIINKDIEKAAEDVFSPRYSMHISRNDGMYNNDINHQKDIIIAACGLIGTCRKYYTDEELAIIHKAKSMNPVNTVTVPVGDFSQDKKPINLAGAAASTHFIAPPGANEVTKDFVEFLNRCKYSQGVYERHGVK